MLKPQRIKDIGFALITAAVIPATIGAMAGGGRGALTNPWIKTALLLVLVGFILLAIWARRDKEGKGDSGAGPAVTQKFIELGHGASLGQSRISDNLVISNVGDTVKSRESVKKKSRHFTTSQQAELTARGNQLASELIEFGSLRRSGDPLNTFPTASRTPVDMAEVASSSNKYRNETKSLYEKEFVGRIAEFLDEAQECGVDIDNSFLQRYPRLVGADPIQETAREIQLITGRIRRAK